MNNKCSKQLPAWVTTEALTSLMELHQKYLDEYERIAYSLMQNVPSHDYFDNWLIATGNYEYNNMVDRLRESGLQIGSGKCDTIFLDQNGNAVDIA